MTTPAPVPAVAPAASTPSTPSAVDFSAAPSLGTVAWGVLSVGSAIVSANHGYERNGGSAGWAVVWGLFGAVAPVLTPIVALVQGYAEPSTDERVKKIERAVERRPDIAAAVEQEMTR
jgi:hypothetical protein